MKTKACNSKKRRLNLTFLSIFLLFNSVLVKAAEETPALNKVAEDNTASFIIIGSVLVLGVVAYIVVNYLSKKEKRYEPNQTQLLNRSKYNHFRHNHRIVKKSA